MKVERKDFVELLKLDIDQHFQDEAQGMSTDIDADLWEALNSEIKIPLVDLTHELDWVLFRMNRNLV